DLLGPGASGWQRASAPERPTPGAALRTMGRRTRGCIESTGGGLPPGLSPRLDVALPGGRVAWSGSRGPHAPGRWGSFICNVRGYFAAGPELDDGASATWICARS